MVLFQCGVNCTKYLLVAFNVLLMLFDFGLTYFQYQIIDEFGFIGGCFSLTSVLRMAAGVITLFVAFFGICGALTENRQFIRLYMVVVTIITALQIAAGLGVVALWEKMKPDIEEGALEAIKRQAKEWDLIQQKLQCCGWYGTLDWVSIFGPKAVAPSCCPGDPSPIIGCNLTTSFSQGCSSEVLSMIKGQLYRTGTIGTALAFVQLFGMVLSMCMIGGSQKGIRENITT